MYLQYKLLLTNKNQSKNHKLSETSRISVNVSNSLSLKARSLKLTHAEKSNHLLVTAEEVLYKGIVHVLDFTKEKLDG